MTPIISYGQHRADVSPARFGATFEQLHAWLRDDARFAPHAGEKDGPYLVFADFGEGGTRDYAHLLASYGVPLDLDLGQYAWDAASIRARLAGRAFIAWTSYSHTPERPRWRIVVPLERGANRFEHYATWESLADVFLRDCGESSKDATRLNYLPGAALHPEHSQLIYSDGTPWPVSAIPEGTLDDAGSEWTGGPVKGWDGPTEDGELIAHMLDVRNSPRDAFAAPGTTTKFQALWQGDVDYLSSLYPPTESHQLFDHTRADAALANELIYFTGGDCERSLRLMEQSALAQRDTWEERKGRRAIEHAQKGRTQYAFVRSAPSVPEGTTSGLIDRTDTGNANLLIALTGGSLRFVSQTKQWLHWTDSRWHIDSTEVFVNSRALEVAEHYVAESEKLRTAHREFDAVELVKWSKKCRNRQTLTNMIEQARKAPGVPIEIDQLDRDPWLLGVENGVVDLRTGELRPEARDDYVTKRCAARYDPSATAPRWERFIVEITGVPGSRPDEFTPRPAVARYLHAALGYAITGSTREQKLFLAVGPGSNGKNVVFDAIKQLLGDYARLLPSDALMATGRSADSERPTALAASLAGARFVLSSETKDGQTLDVGLVKNHTGDAEMTARRMRENPFTFKITHKLWLMTNNRPALDHIDAAIRGRLHVIPFERRWNRPGEFEHDPTLPDGDKGLAEQLASESQGILSWLVRGAQLYQREGLTPPAEVVNLTREYVKQQDQIGQWLDTMQRVPADQGKLCADLLGLFSQFSGGGYRGRVNEFGLLLQARGVGTKRTNKGARYGLIPGASD